MARPSSPHTVHPNSSNDHSFMPRREFIRDDRTPSSFSILTLSSSSLIRLFSFSSTLVSAVRRLLLEKELLGLGFREDPAQHCCEFSLEGKPWTNPKSTRTEKLLVDILAVLFQHGYFFLSTIDYGREQDDRIVMAFTKPDPSTIPQSATSPVSSVRKVNDRSSTPSTSPVRVPFAISFPNATTLRVVSPPLHSTPAILQAVRGAWPRGVASEKKVGDSTFEFKLKGYKWFQEDTFATDSLQHVLGILASLDAHGFTLQASLSLSNRSRVKDLWIFTGNVPPGFPDSPPASPDMSKTSLQAAQGVSDSGRLFDHRRLNTMPEASQPLHLDKAAHERAATDKPSQGAPLSQSPALLRKPAPRAQIPVSVASSVVSQDGPTLVSFGHSNPLSRTSEELVRANLPSAVGSVTDMTGVGAGGGQGVMTPSTDPSPAIFYATAPNPLLAHNPYFPPTADIPSPVAMPEPHPHTPTPPPLQSSPQEEFQSSPPAELAPTPQFVVPTSPPDIEKIPREAVQSSPSISTPTPPLLSPTAFRDSAFSSNTTQTYEIPIRWTGKEAEKDSDSRKTPALPSAWASPVEEKELELEETTSPAAGDDEGGIVQSGRDFLSAEGEFRPRPKEMTPQEKEVKSGEPELVRPETDRKSEAVLLGELPRAPPPERKSEGDRKSEADTVKVKQEKHRSVDGWVLVNIAQSQTQSGPLPPSHAKSAFEPATTLSAASIKDNKRSPTPNGNGTAHEAGASLDSSVLPAAKAMAIMDAVDAQSAKSGREGAVSPQPSSKSIAEPPQPSGSGFRRLFSFNGRSESPTGRKEAKARRKMSQAGVMKTKSLAQEEIDEKKKKPSKWRKNKVPPEVSQVEKRVSVE